MNALLRASRRNQGPVFAAALFAVLFVAFPILHPRGLSIMATTPAANQGLALAFATMAQTLPVLAGGLDLSVGSVPALTNCVAWHLVSGSTVEILSGIAVRCWRGGVRLRQRAGRRRGTHPTHHREVGDGRDLHRDRVSTAPDPWRKHRRRPRRSAEQRNLRCDPDLTAATRRRGARGLGAIP